jgi:hypothetical protein
MRNTDGGFYRLAGRRMTGTSQQALGVEENHWGGRAAADWARQLADGRGFDPAAERLIDSARVLDRIYGR